MNGTNRKLPASKTGQGHGPLYIRGPSVPFRPGAFSRGKHTFSVARCHTGRQSCEMELKLPAGGLLDRVIVLAEALPDASVEVAFSTEHQGDRSSDYGSPG